MTRQVQELFDTEYQSRERFRKALKRQPQLVTDTELRNAVLEYARAWRNYQKRPGGERLEDTWAAVIRLGNRLLAEKVNR